MTENGRANLIMTPEYKAWFKKNKELHGKESLGELLDESVYKLMVDTDPYKAYTLKIEQLEKELKETKVLRKSLPSIIVSDSDITSKTLLNPMRLELFAAHASEISKRDKSNTLSMLNLKHFVLDGSFKDKKEVVEAMREYARHYIPTEKTIKSEPKIIDRTDLTEKEIVEIRQRLWTKSAIGIRRAIRDGGTIMDFYKIDEVIKNGFFDSDDQILSWVQTQIENDDNQTPRAAA